MRVFIVCVFTCVLLQGAILQEQVINQLSKPPNLSLAPAGDGDPEEKSVLKLEENTNSTLEEKPELTETEDSKLKENTDLDSEKPEGEGPSNPARESKVKGPEKPASTDVGPPECLKQKYTWQSCSKVFCPPWKRCINGQCLCQMPYKCPRQEYNACTLDGSQYYSMCQANAIACRTNKPTFSHIGSNCKEDEMVRISLENFGDENVILINTPQGEKLVCGWDWNIAAANVACRSSEKSGRLAEAAAKIEYAVIKKNLTSLPKECVRVRCRGYEFSLAECTIYKPQSIAEDRTVAALKCSDKIQENCGEKFRCVNGKCVSNTRTCNGVDDCGDNSDEMCCERCQEKKAFRCKSGVCIPLHAVGDKIRDCLGGEDEVNVNITIEDPKKLLLDPMSEIRSMRSSMEEKLKCGIPNMDYVYKQETEKGSRRKRLVGGEEALPTQIQWQVAIQDEGSIHCGGAYLGGCWVLTAAHCVRPKPRSFHVKFSLWKKFRRQSTTDIIPVKNIIIHQDYNPQTYVNDIALVQLEEFNLSDKCMKENPAVRAVCVPWSTEQFQPNDTCTISGWGRNREGKSASILKWANVTIIGDCQNYYKNRFLPGMECAGDLEGKVDSCQGDSGGPLVCKDASGLSYVWGIVSWGDKCGEANSPGVYTKVAHYFDWIRFHTGWPTVTKFNQ